jgi:hypothetical protein
MLKSLQEADLHQEENLELHGRCCYFIVFYKAGWHAFEKAHNEQASVNFTWFLHAALLNITKKVLASTKAVQKRSGNLSMATIVGIGSSCPSDCCPEPHSSTRN